MSITADEAVVEAKSLLTEVLVAQLKPCRADGEVYQKRIADLLEKFEDGTRFKSLPGVDVMMAAKLLEDKGTDRERFKGVNELQSLFGTAPYTKRKGQYKNIHFRKACHKRMRADGQQMALASLRTSAWALVFCQKAKRGLSCASCFSLFSQLVVKSDLCPLEDKDTL